MPVQGFGMAEMVGQPGQKPARPPGTAHVSQPAGRDMEFPQSPDLYPLCFLQLEDQHIRTGQTGHTFHFSLLPIP